MRIQVELLKLLEQNGWSVTRRRIGLESWAHEIWTLESVWSPIGLTLCLTFLTDPQPGNPNPFCAVGTSRQMPENRTEAGGEPYLPVTPHWIDELPGFVLRLHQFRQEPGSTI